MTQSQDRSRLLLVEVNHAGVYTGSKLHPHDLDHTEHSDYSLPAQSSAFMHYHEKPD